MVASERRYLRKAAIYTAYEFMLVVLPVALYAALAAVAEPKVGAQPPHGLGSSPEWNIATIFLVAQAQSLYRLHVESSGRRISHPALGLIALISLTIIVCAVANVQIALHAQTGRTILVMWILFAVATFAFVGFVTGARLLSLRSRGGHE